MGVSPLFPLFVHFFALFFRSFGWVREANCCCYCYVYIFLLHTQSITVFGFTSLQTCCVPFFGLVSKPENSQKIPGCLRPTLHALYQLTPGEQQGNRWPCSTMTVFRRNQVLFTLNNTAVIGANATCFTYHSAHTLHTHRSGPHKLAVGLLLYRGCHKVEISRA